MFVSPSPANGLVFLFTSALLLAVIGRNAQASHTAPLAMHTPEDLTVLCRGPLGERVERNIENWLLTAVDANPRMLEMFRTRDRKPLPDLVPWAGEFIGKYLLSAIQACRMTERPELKEDVQRTITELLSTQAEDGYLGPFPKEERLLAHWDLWGHYHVMLALLIWHEKTGDKKALNAATQIGDLVCNTFLDTDKRAIDAGSDEMNLAIIHSLGWLYRATSNERYLRMMREIERDWESAGDYFRTGVQGLEFFRIPRPRWESLHDLQGLVELYRITGEERYREAFINHWTSIMQHDRHPSGGFSTDERALGNPYMPGAIETCCTTAWVALSVDMLRLTGDPRVADELELATWNSVLGSQHPSGRWWTYDTPLNGVRQASAHHIVFQARYGMSELNCCSVNGPRGLGALSEWAVMLDEAGPLLNFYGPSKMRFSLEDGTGVTITQDTAYPAEGEIRIHLNLDQPKTFNLRLRIPVWSTQTTVAVNGKQVTNVEPATFLALKRKWVKGDRVKLTFDMVPRYWAGELTRQGTAAIYYGPLLLAFDPKYNLMDTDAIPPLDARRLDSQPIVVKARFQPLVVRQFTASDGTSIVLCDFATAGAHGTDYVAWLPIINARPAPFYLKRPRPRETVGRGPLLFEWTGYGGSGEKTARTFSLKVMSEAHPTHPLINIDGLLRPRYLLTDGLPVGGPYTWQVVAHNQYGATEALNGPALFTVAAAPQEGAKNVLAYELGEGELMLASPLDGNGAPTIGVLESATNIEPAEDRHGQGGGAVYFGGEGCALKYRLPYFPERDYTFHAWIRPEGLPADRLHQVFSAWAMGMDDPLRIVIQGNELFARIEASVGYSTAPVPVENDRWYHVAAVKEGAKLSLYVDGKLREKVDVPEWIATSAMNVAVGANPNYRGNECFCGRIDDFAFYARALTAEEIRSIYEQGG
ncbi:MAG: beta-L-arabinofuranosidase domain-containing protein [Candidatus Zipacnadales bacterium]